MRNADAKRSAAHTPERVVRIAWQIASERAHEEEDPTVA
jgi:hypothetical protein